MRCVLKYTLHAHGEALVPLPAGAIIRHVADRGEALHLWAEVDDEMPLHGRRLLIAYTGVDEIPAGAVFIATVPAPGGAIVSHLYELVVGPPGTAPAWPTRADALRGDAPEAR